MIYLKNRKLIDVHAKTGESSFAESFRDYKIRLGPARSLARRPKLHQIVCMVRSPHDRLLSAWRMFYMHPAMNLLEHRKKISNLPNIDIVYDTMLNPERYLKDPVYAFNHWCKNNHIEQFFAKDDPHFMPLYNAYSRWMTDEFKHKLVFCNRINAVYEALDIEPVYNNVGVWPWKNIRKEDFYTGNVDQIIRKHYLLDLEIYSKSTHTL